MPHRPSDPGIPTLTQRAEPTLSPSAPLPDAPLLTEVAQDDAPAFADDAFPLLTDLAQDDDVPLLTETADAVAMPPSAAAAVGGAQEDAIPPEEAVANQGIHPDIVLEAIDADVIKTYVDVGLGIGIIAGVAYDPRRDSNLVGLPVGHLFGTHTTRVGVKAGVFLRDYVYTFLEMLAPSLTRAVVTEAVQGTAK